MSNEQSQRWRIAAPKTITVNDFKSLVEGLNDFLPGLKTVNRVIKSRAITSDGTNDLEGNTSWKVYQPYVFDKIEQLQFELTLNKTETNSCQLHIEFRKNHLYLSVSDIGTDWRDAVFEEAERRLKEKGLFRGEFVNRLTSTFIRLQNVFLIIGASLLILTHIDEDINFKYFSFSLIATGLVPIISDIFHFYFPSKSITILKEKSITPSWSIEKISVWVGISSGIVTLVKEMGVLIGGAQ